MESHLFRRLRIGGFASLDNLSRAKLIGVKDVSFSKRRGLSVLEMVKSLWVYRKLKLFEPGLRRTFPD